MMQTVHGIFLSTFLGAFSKEGATKAKTKQKIKSLDSLQEIY
jgi:hypothetical protein